MQKFHFISGLPRSGSTLLSALLRQNPRFSAAMTSPVGSLCSAVLPKMSGTSEFATFFDGARRADILRGLFYSYHGVRAQGGVVFDSNRRWSARLPLLHELFPGARTICCVRDVAQVIDSLERIIRRHPTSMSRIVGEGGKTVYARVETYMDSEKGIIGFAWSALRDAWFSESAQSLIVVPYERLASQPARTLAALYDLLEEPRFEHDFDDVHYQADEFDLQAGTPGLHTVRRRVAFEAREPILPPDIVARYADTSFWANPKLNRRNVTVL